MKWLTRIITASQWGREAAVPSNPGPSTEGMKTMASVSTLLPKSKPQAGTVHWFNQCVEQSKRGDFAEVVTITPGLANVMLQDNPNNRNLSEKKVAEYSRDMTQGRWTYNMEPIIFATTGELNDGQHRLHAIIEANRPQKMLVAFGAARESRTTIDQGMARTAGHYLAMQGVSDGNLCSSIARLVMSYERTGGRDYRDRSQTHAEVVARVLADDAILEAAKATRNISRFAKGLLTPSQIGACFYIFAEYDAEDAQAYLSQVCVGENIKRRDPAFTVRQALGSLDDEYRLRRIEIVMRGWNAFRQGRKLSQMQTTGNLPALV